MTRYDLLLLLHVLGAMLWLGGATLMTLAAFRASRAPTPAELAQLGALAGWLAPRLFLPSLLAVGASGIALTLDGGWPLGELWLQLGLAAYGVSLATQFLFREPELRRMRRANAQLGPGNPETARRGRRLVLVGRAELALLVLVAADMVLRPQAGDTGVLAGGAAILFAALAAMLLGGRRRHPAPAGPRDTAARPA